MRFFPGVPLMHPAGLMVLVFSMVLVPVLARGAESENDGKKILQSCQVALELLDTDAVTGDFEAVKFCDDYLTGFRENENVKEIHMGERYHRGY